MNACCSFTRRRSSSASSAAQASASSGTSISGFGHSSFSSPLTVLFAALRSRPLSWLPHSSRPWSDVEPGGATQLAPALGEEVADEPEVVGEVRGIELGDVPAREVGVDPVVERGVVAHLLRHRPEEVAAA